MKIPLLGGSGGDREEDNSQSLTQNWYVSKTRGKSQIVLYPTPGLTLFGTLAVAGIRGSIEYGDSYFVVSGNTFYEVDAAGNSVAKGTISTSSGRVSLAHNGKNNGTEILICTRLNGNIYDSVLDTVVQIADGDFPQTATHCAFFDGRFVVNDPAITGQIAISSSYDGTAWDATEVATAERSPDALQALVVSNRILWLVGTHTAEPWNNTGAGDFPYEPIQSAFSQWGTIAPFSLLEIAGMTLWLSQNDEGQGMVVASLGGTPQAVSSPEIAVEIAKLSVINDAYAWSYQYQQHAFYVLTFPTGEKTFVYDISLQEWHQWSSKTLGYHRSAAHTFVYGKHLIGDPVSGNIYELDWGVYTDNGDEITRTRRSQSIHGDDKEIIHDGVWLDTKEGVGTVAHPDPEIQLRWRDSNGSWSNYHPRSMGAQGERGKRLVWRNLGRSFDRVYEIQTSAPVNAVIIDSYAKVRGAREFG